MNTEHTPGPWAVYPDSHGGHSIVHEITKQGVGATIPMPRFDGTNGQESKAEALANAHLIAAAPDLLNALLIAVNQLRMMSIASSEEGNESSDWAAYSSSHEMKQIRAAIDKATQTI